MSLIPVCVTCGAVRWPDAPCWLPVNEPPPQNILAASKCPLCEADEARAARPAAACGPSWLRHVGASLLHPFDVDSDGGAFVVDGRGE